MLPQSSRMTSARHLLPAILLLGAPLSATLAQTPGKPPGSDIIIPAAKDDRFVKRCRFLALRRQNPKLDAMTTTVEHAAMLLDVPVVHDAVAACRMASASYPTDRDVIIATHTAVEALGLILFGLTDHPRTPAEAVSRAIALAEKEDDRFMGRMLAFYLGSAYHHGIGVTADIVAAERWYRRGVMAGDRVSMRELARILMSGGGRAPDYAEAALVLIAAIKAGDEHERAELIESKGAMLSREMRSAIQRALIGPAANTLPPSRTFDDATLAALAALPVKK